MPEFKLKVSAETQEFGQQIKGVVKNLNDAGGEGFGDKFGKSVEKGFHGKFRGLMHAGHLFASVFGGMLGAQVENSILGSVKAGVMGAMGGAFIGGLPGALVGGLGGLISNFVLKAVEQKKAVTELAEKFHVSATTVREMSDSMNNDQIAKTLKEWNDLLQGIIDKRPELVKALNDMGIGTEGAMQMAPHQLMREAALRTAREFFGRGSEHGNLREALADIDPERAKGFVHRVETVFGGYDKFNESLQAANKSGAAGQPTLYDYIANELRVQNVAVGEQTKRYADLQAMLERVKKTRFELLTPTEQLAEKEKEMADVQKELSAGGYMSDEYKLYLQGKQLDLIKDIHGLSPNSTGLPKPDDLARAGIYLTSGAARYDRQFQLQEGMNNKIDQLINATRNVGADVAKSL